MVDAQLQQRGAVVPIGESGDAVGDQQGAPRAGTLMRSFAEQPGNVALGYLQHVEGDLTGVREPKRVLVRGPGGFVPSRGRGQLGFRDRKSVV